MHVKIDNTAARSSLELTFSVLSAVYMAGSEGILAAGIELSERTNHVTAVKKLKPLEEAGIVECTREERNWFLRSRITDKGARFYHEFASFMEQNIEFHTSAAVKRDILGVLRTESVLASWKIASRIDSDHHTVADRADELVVFGLLNAIKLPRTDKAYSITQTGTEKYLRVDDFVRKLSELNIRI